MLQLFLLLSSRVNYFTSFHSTRKRKNTSLKEKAGGIHYSLDAFLKVQKLLFLWSIY